MQVPKAAYFNPASPDLGNTPAVLLGLGEEVAVTHPSQERRAVILKKVGSQGGSHISYAVSIYLMRALLILCRFPINPLRGTKPRAVRKAGSTASVRLSLPNKPLTSSASLPPSIFPKLLFTIHRVTLFEFLIYQAVRQCFH